MLFYQSGLAELADARAKPGFVCHAEAVAANAAAGHRVYDFLGGDSRYKLSLATGEQPLIWARVQRQLVRFSVEEQLREWKHHLSGQVQGIMNPYRDDQASPPDPHAPRAPRS